MKLHFLEAARDDLVQAYHYYKVQEPNVGKAFLEEIRDAMERIRQLPNAWHPLSERTRRCLLRRFPYGMIYQIREDELLIVAVAHLHREADYWRGRV